MTKFICIDCLYWHEHGSLVGLDPVRYWEVASTASRHWVYVAPAEGEDGFVAFSRQPCDACGTELAGQRFPAVEMEVKK